MTEKCPEDPVLISWTTEAENGPETFLLIHSGQSQCLKDSIISEAVSDSCLNWNGFGNGPRNKTDYQGGTPEFTGVMELSGELSSFSKVSICPKRRVPPIL